MAMMYMQYLRVAPQHNFESTDRCTVHKLTRNVDLLRPRTAMKPESFRVQDNRRNLSQSILWLYLVEEVFVT